MKRYISRVRSLSCLAAMLAVASPAVAAMNDYCIQPPFINASIPPNLLLLIDNSASMYDLSYVDKGKKNPDGTFARQPYYCYDQTYRSDNAYVGYFDPVTYYSYNFTTKAFEAGASLPASTSCTKFIANNLCIVHTDTAVTSFVAKGNYLNWLTASKFDVQKEILTGGKYESGKLIAESRGCVGQPFVKEANQGDFVNYSSPETNNLNASLGITFGVRGAPHPVNPSAPSLGGKTSVDIYLGNYNQGDCQGAVAAITSGGNADIKQAVDACLAYSGTGTQTAVTKTKVSFQQSMQACWQYREGKALGTDDINTVKNQCTDIYDEYATCSNDPKKLCTSSADCGAGNTCNYGPSAILPGNPALLCGNEYEGQYYYFQSSTTVGSCTQSGNACTSDADCPAINKCSKEPFNVCTSDSDCTANGSKCRAVGNTCSSESGVSGWFLRPGTTEEAMIDTHEQFCSDMTASPVTDPTDSPSDTSMYDNVPAILSGIGLEAQLNQPIGTLNVALSAATQPAGLVQEYSDRIRFGVMHFNNYGSASETTALGAPKVCSHNAAVACTTNIDCGTGNTCQETTAGTSNVDGGKIKYYIGKGKCSATTGTECATDANCPSGERCITDGPGDHSTSNTLIKVIDEIPAATWTPFAEAMYNAIGYFAKDLDADDPDITSRSDLRLSTEEALSFPLAKNPVQFKCQSNNILIISDGMSTADQNSSVSTLAQLYTAAGGETGTCSQYAGSKNLDNLAWLAQHRNIQKFSTTAASTDVPDKRGEFINTFVVFTGESNGQAGECNSQTLMEQTAVKGGGKFYKAENHTLEAGLKDVFDQVAKATASGTAASILSNSEGSGASILQAVFYPKKDFLSNTSATWLGEMQNLWYYVDPNIGNSTVREDTEYDGSTRALNLLGDKVVEFYFDATEGRTKAKLTPDTDGDGDGDGTGVVVDPDAIKSLWRAGNQLWSRNLTTAPRDITTTCLKETCTEATMAFSAANASVLRPYLGVADDDEAEKIIQYVHGTDFADLRSRTVTTKNILTGNTETHVWKLGDIISSTPRILSPLRLNTYHLSLPSGYNDASYSSFLGSNEYKARNLAFVGANDGMLHAFRLGTMDVRASGSTKAKLTGSDIGKEVGAFIPKHTLPYLKYLAGNDYNHLFFVDGPTLVFDATIGKPGSCSETNYWECVKPSKVVDENKDLDATKNPWRTILIGSMGLGGAAKSALASCTADLNGDAAVDDKDCVKTPITDPEDATKGFGYSSYFAFDFTDQENASLLWEFSDPNLGFSTSGPAIIRVGDPAKNGKWFAVFASGPTGPIDTGTHQFLGRSDQPLRLFVLDLATGQHLATIEKTTANTTIDNAFAGSLAGAAIDTDRWNSISAGLYEDDAIYFGYVQKDATAGTWTKGGVLRLLTGEDTNPANWKLSPVIKDTGPVTSAIGRLQDRKNKNLWLYFGTGRYYFKKTTDNQNDDFDTQQAIYGIKEPCYTSGNALNKTCTTTLELDDLTDQTSGTAVAASDDKGWYIELDDNSGVFGSERVVSDPTTLTNGLVIFASFMPTGDPCEFGGKSYLWAVRYDTGTEGPVKALEGKVLIQLSTGAFEEKNLHAAFTDKAKRRSGGDMQGKPPGDQALVITKSQNKPVKKILHIRER